MKAFLWCAAAIAVAACGTTDPNTIEDTIMPGSVSFDFVGAGSSSSRRFDATGAISITDPAWGTTPVAGAQINSSRPVQTLVLGAVPVTDTVWNQALLRVNRLSVGSSIYKTTCFGVIDCRADSSAVQIEFGARHGPTTMRTPYVCSILDGTITITSISDRRVTGTFSGTGLCTEPNNAQTPFAVANGVFDVGILISGKPLPKS